MKKSLLLILVILSALLAFSACKKDCAHENYYVEHESSADCYHEGTRYYNCLDCGEFLRTETIPATGHSFSEWDVTSEPTCTQVGIEKRYCYNCALEEQRNTPLAEHDFSSWECLIAPDCDDSGKEYRYCYHCRDDEERYVAPLGHTPNSNAVKTNEIPATCYSEGSYDMVVYCVDCGEALETTTHTTSKTQHTPASAVEENRINATYEKDGSYDMVVYCSVSACHEELERTTYTLDMLVHHPGTAVIENRVESTCIKAGSYDEVVYCLDEDCGHKELSRKTIALELAAHIGGNAVIENAIAATCTANGSYDEVVYCKTCNVELSRAKRTTDKADHTSSPAVSENVVDATCTENGSYDEVVYCSECNAELSRSKKATAKLGHTPSDSVVENYVDSSCTKAGSYDNVIYCSVCGDEISRETVAIEIADHTPSATVKENVIESTCTSFGSYDKVVYCSVCGVEMKREASIDNSTKPHQYDGNECTVCGDLCESKGLSFTPSDDGTYYSLAGRGECNDKNIVVPESYNGLPVKIVESSAFLNDTTLKSINIPSSVTSIGRYALKGCSSVESLSLPFVGETASGSTLVYHLGYIFGVENKDIPQTLKSVTVRGFIGSEAFRSCSRITDVTILNQSVISSSAFAYCSSLEKVTLPAKLQGINPSAFRDCTSLKEIILPDMLQDIGLSAFSGCTALTSIVVPNSVTSIGESAFYNCKALTSITIPFVGSSLESGTPSHFGYIFGAADYANNAKYVPTTLKTVVVAGYQYHPIDQGNGCTIRNNAFYGCSYIESITVENASISSYAFQDCTRLKSITIGRFDNVSTDSFVTINNYAFKGCTSLNTVVFGNFENSKAPNYQLTIYQNAFNGSATIANVYYAGTAEEWQNIAIVATGNEAFTAATIHYNYVPEE